MKTAHSNHSLTNNVTGSALPWHARRLSLVLLLCVFAISASASEAKRVTLMRTPEGGIQPQAAVDSQGVVHLIYYKGDPLKGDIFYARQAPRQSTFSKPIQVNSQRGSAIATGTIRGAQLALGKKGRVHVVWNGGDGATSPTINGKAVTPVLYTRLNDAGTGFEPERNLITYAAGLDGGSSVAADSQGKVYVTWHASKPGLKNTNDEDPNVENGRAVFVARSADDGKTFAREKMAIQKPTGACGCCAMKAFTDTQGNLFVLYRVASDMMTRGMMLLVSRNHGADFEIALEHPWKVGRCPMSSASFSEAKAGVLAAWETEGKVYFAQVNPSTLKVSEPMSPPGKAQGKHPVAVGNAQGEVLRAWTEGTGWAKGGAVAWQLYDKDGNPADEKGRAAGVPVWSLATAFAKPDGSFVVVY